MSTTTPTFATLRALHAVIGDALDEIQHVCSHNVPIETSSLASSRSSSQPCPNTSDVFPVPSVSATPSISFPPTPLSANFADCTDPHFRRSSSVVDYPSPDKPYQQGSPSEQLAAHPRVTSATLKIIAACGRISSIIHKPFLTLCDAVMSYNLPACLRLIEHLHVVEILREAEGKRQKQLAEMSKEEAAVSTRPSFLFVTQKNKPDPSDNTLVCTAKEEAHQINDGPTTHFSFSQQHGADDEASAHALRLLSTHHIMRETAPDTFALTRVASLLDTGKSTADIFAWADELFKSAAYLTEAFTGVHLPSSVENDDSAGDLVQHKQDTFPAFNLAFYTTVPYFNWLENDGKIRSAEQAMIGTSGWETSGAIFIGFDWKSLPKGSSIVDVGGGIGSTTMALARAFSSRKLSNSYEQNVSDGRFPQSIVERGSRPHDGSLLRDGSRKNVSRRTPHFCFVIQDTSAVTRLGLAAWKSQYPELLDSGQVEFKDHDFFQPQPQLEPPHHAHYPAVYLLRVVLHNWPDSQARRILVNLRLASGPETKFIIADYVLPLACIEEEIQGKADVVQGQIEGEWTLDSVLANLEGAEISLASPPLLPNLGKASANSYSMGILMHTTFNGKERTLRELCALALSAGWRVTRMTRSNGSLFVHLVCEPIPVPDDITGDSCLAAPATLPSMVQLPPPPKDGLHPPSQFTPCHHLPGILARPSSRCGTPTFGSQVSLPPPEDLRDLKDYGAGTWSTRKWLKSKGFGLRDVMA
ncbi:hypothetical protein V8B97DRAFT_2002489 [Scleroderma yunnanense]